MAVRHMQGALVSGLLALCLALATGGAAAGTQADPTIYPTVAGMTVIRADGVSGIKLDFPRDVRWFKDNISLEMSNAVDRAFVGVRSHLPPTELCDLCFGPTWVTAAPRSAMDTVVGHCEDANRVETGCLIPAGVHELYFVSDGVITFTMRFPELSGAQEVDATGVVAGGLEPIPVSCKVPDCSVVGGGLVRQIGLGGKAAAAVVIAMVNTAETPPANPSAINVTSCAYPGYFNNKAADAAAYPLGCDVADADDNETAGFLVPNTALVGFGAAMEAGSGKTHGGQYLGFTAHSRALLGSSKVSAWAHWFNEGIACPSGNFFYCPVR